jgi:uroporphyrinogen decarboxylase
MTPRERVRAVLSHQIPDRIPNGLGACETAGLHVLAYEKLQKILGVKTAPPRIGSFEANAVFELDLIKAMEGDMLLLASPKLCKSDLRGPAVEAQWKEQELWGRHFRVCIEDEFVKEPDGSVTWKTGGWRGGPPLYNRPPSFFFDEAALPLDMGETDYLRPEDVNPSGDWPDEILRHLEETAWYMYETTDLSLSIGECLPDFQYLPGGFLKGWMFIAEYPERMAEILSKMADAALTRLGLLEQAVGKYVDIINMAHDLGDNRGLIVGPETYQTVYAPNYKKLFQGWKKITGMKLCLHTCGAVREALGDLQESGLDIYNPVQISGANMDPAELKSDFPGIIYYGGAYDHHLCSPEESYESIYEKTSRNIKALAKNGGYILAGVHNLLPEIPAHHLKAILDAWQDNRDYPEYNT